MSAISKYIKEHSSRADKAFDNHKLIIVGPGHWIIRNPNDSCYWAEIVVMSNIAITVWGDIDTCTFAYCGGAKSPEAIVSWMARADVGYYGHQKASIGMGRIGIDEWDIPVAREQLSEYIEQAKEEISDETELGEYRAILMAAKLCISSEDDIRELHQYLVEKLQDLDPDCYEWIYDLGKVPSIRLIYALAAIRKLHGLLQESTQTE